MRKELQCPSCGVEKIKTSEGVERGSRMDVVIIIPVKRKPKGAWVDFYKCLKCEHEWLK